MLYFLAKKEEYTMSFFYLDESSAKQNKVSQLCFNLLRHTPEKSLIAFPSHNHEIFEILYILNGNLKVTLDKKDYYLSSGDILIVNPFQLHYGEYPDLNNSVEYLAFTINMRKWLHIPYISSELESILDCSAGFTNLVSSTDKLAPEISNLILNIEKANR